MWQANKLGKGLQKGRKIKKSQFHVQQHYIFSQLEIVCLLMCPTPVNLITGLDDLTNVLWENWLKWRPCQWDGCLSKDRAFVRWICGGST